MGKSRRVVLNVMGSAAEWHAFLDEFRAFGGRAENVMQRKGAFGMGLFPIDPAKPVDLFVPDNLLVAVDNVHLVDGSLVIKDESDCPEGYGDWFRRYQSAYSWGAEGRDNTKAFEEGLKHNYDTLIFDDGLQEMQIDFDIKLVCFKTKNWILNSVEKQFSRTFFRPKKFRPKKFAAGIF